MQRVLNFGVIPGLCAGASACFALYAAKVLHAADLWCRTEGHTPRLHHEARAHGVQLRQHGWTCGALTLISSAITVEALRDWRAYCGQPIAAMEGIFASRLPFFARPSVLATAACSLAGAWWRVGAVRLVLPQRPIA